MIVETQRLLLRELLTEDSLALNEIERDARVTRFMPFEPQSPDQTSAYIDGAIRDQKQNPRTNYDLAIVLRDEGTHAAGDPKPSLIGRCGLGIRRPEHREAVIWYELHPAHWGKGYAKEAATAVLNLAFGPLGLHRVLADCDPRNIASCRIAVQLGMTLEGHLRENYLLKGEWCNSAIYGLLEDEWRRRGGCAMSTG